MHTAHPAAIMGGRPNPLRRAEAWLDQRGRPAWIIATVLGFVLFWPLGLATLGYMIFAGKFKRHTFGQEDHSMFCRHRRSHHHAAWRSSGLIACAASAMASTFGRPRLLISAPYCRFRLLKAKASASAI